MTDDRLINERYRIVRLVGQGGMGAVYEATDTRLRCPVALKQLKSIAGYPTEAFEREAMLLAQLRHPVLPVVTDYFVAGDDRFVVMQFIAGQDLSAGLKSRLGGFPEPQVLAWLDQVLDALAYLHGFQPPIVHRDIKPANLKLTPQGEIILLDFGLAKGGLTAGDGGSLPSVVGYTPRYAPLEQIEGRGTDVRSDIYALGATVCHLLTGVAPANAVERARAVVDDLPDPLTEERSGLIGIEPELRAILLRAVALKSADRFSSAGEMREELRALPARRRAAEEEFSQPTLVVAPSSRASSPTGVTASESAAERASRPRPRLVLGLMTLVLVLAAAFGGAYWQAKQRASGNAGNASAVSEKRPTPNARAPFDIPAPSDADSARPPAAQPRSAADANARPPAPPARKVAPSAAPAADLGPVVRAGQAVPSSNFGDVVVTVVSITRPESSVLRLNLLFENASADRVSIALDYSSSGLSDARGERYPVVNHAINRTPGWTFEARLEPGGQARHWIDVVAPAPGVNAATLELATPSGSGGAARFEPFLLRLPAAPQ